MVVVCTLVFLPVNGKSVVVVSIMSVGLAHYGGIKAVRFSGRMPDHKLTGSRLWTKTFARLLIELPAVLERHEGGEELLRE
jgi:hypothetical protein